jgi:type I restriction enzyme, S subunit
MYKKYPKYKPSGVEWIGEIPEEWDVKPLFTVLKERCLKNIGNREKNVLSLSYGNIIRRDINENFGLLPESFETYQIVEKGNIILRLTDLQNDKRSLRVGLVNEKGIITSAYVCLEIANNTNKYLSMLLHAYDFLKVFYGFGGGVRQSMKYEDIKRLPIILPPLSEQAAIADFLDEKTAKIDEVIGKKKRLIELLDEYKTAIINHAVTKGPNPNAKMKPSGIEWIGEIPEEWEVKKLKWVFKTYNGSTPKSDIIEYWDGDICWITPDDLGKLVNEIILTSNRKITKKGYDSCGTSLVPAGSLVLSTRAPIGHLAIAGVQLCSNQGCRCLVFKRNDSKRFFYYLLKTQKNELESCGQGTTFLELGSDKLNSIKLLVPPLSEQSAIAEYLDKKTAEIEKAKLDIQKEIETLKEYRTALISEAVTGKIKV